MSGDDLGALAVYDLPIGTRLRGDWFPLYHRRLMGSRFVATVGEAAAFRAILLWCAAAEQDPAGTLPDDDAELAHLAQMGRDRAGWRKLRDGALYGWGPVRVFGEGREARRLAHPVVTEVMVEAVRRMDERRAASVAGGQRSRTAELRKQMRKAGAPEAMIADGALVEQVWADLADRGLRWHVQHVRASVERVQERMARDELAAMRAVSDIAARRTDMLRSR